ncbi:MAG: STAS/SEC14 domain-containing protein [Bacteroidota bacterium]
MFRVLDFTKDDVIAIHAEGKITKHDYEKINPLIDKTVREKDHVKLFIELDEVEAIKPDAFVEDVKAYLKNFNKIEKVAVTGDSSWQKIISKISSPFVAGKVKYFPKNQAIEAQRWIQS